MGTGLKVFLWIVGILALLIALIVGGAFYVGYKAMGSMEEATAFAKTTDKQGCLTEVANRMKD